MRYILVLVTLGIISCNPKSNSDINKNPSNQNEVVEESQESSDWNNVIIQEIPEKGYFPQFTKSGDEIVFTTSNYQGLWLYSLNDKSKTELSNARGAGYKPILTNNSILYEVKSKTTSYEQVDLASKKSSPIADMEKAASLKAYASKDYSAPVAVVASDLNSIDLYTKGKKTESITIDGMKNILNASISPNGKQILVEVSGKGGYITDLNGKIIHELGDLDTPSWLSDQEILYAKVEDDGMKTTSGEIYVKDISNNKEYSISSGYSGILQNPQPNESGNKVTANTINGNIIIISKN